VRFCCTAVLVEVFWEFASLSTWLEV